MSIGMYDLWELLFQKKEMISRNFMNQIMFVKYKKKISSNIYQQHFTITIIYTNCDINWQ